jgi:CheY-like chemotaxis protein
MRDLSAILSSLLGTKEVELVFAIAPELPATVQGDVARLRQVLINLASNAIKFTERGEISVTLAPDGPDRIGFAVQDSGIGIAHDKLDSIFDGFTQAEASTSRRFGGTGLGLTISQRLVALMGGKLTADSTPGQGSRFAFAARFATVSEAPEAAPAAALKVLVVDDNALARQTLVGMAAASGWQAVDAASGEEALAVLAASDAFDVVLVDWRMPRMDGWELARRIGAEYATPIVIMVTAHGRGALAERPPEERALIKGFLTKPVTPAMLREAVAGARAAPAQEAMRSIRAAGSGQLAGLRVLVVDDNPMNQQIAQLLLVHEGAEVDVAGGGAAALEMAAQQGYDAILMDVQMPDMDGYQCTRALRRQSACAATPIIAMTANVMDSDREACLAAGMDEHVGKPIDIAILAAVLLRHCRHIGAAPAAAPPAPLRAPGSSIEFEQALARLGGNRELFAALAGTYVLEAKQFLDQLGPALALPGYEGAPNILHTFKSAAGIVGAAELQNYAAGLESLLRSGETVDPGLALKAVQLLVDISIADLALSVAAL